MTCIVAVTDGKNICMGADSVGAAGNHLIIRKDVKVFKNKNMLFGYTSSFRMGQILRFKFKIPKHPKNIDIYKYMCTIWIDSVRKCLKENGYTHVHNNEETIGVFLVGYKGRIFHIDNDLQVGENIYLYDACGCGERYALGSLATSKSIHMDYKVKKALEVAEQFNGAVRRPFIIETLK